MSTFRELRLVARPVGEVRTSDFEVAEAELGPLEEGSFVVDVTTSRSTPRCGAG